MSESQSRIMIMQGRLHMQVAFRHLASAQWTLTKIQQSQAEGVTLHSDILAGLLVELLLQDQIAVMHKHVIHELQGVTKQRNRRNKLTKCEPFCGNRR
jgi:hypothetical protein